MERKELTPGVASRYHPVRSKEWIERILHPIGERPGNRAGREIAENRCPACGAQLVPAEDGWLACSDDRCSGSELQWRLLRPWLTMGFLPVLDGLGEWSATLPEVPDQWGHPLSVWRCQFCGQWCLGRGWPDRYPDAPVRDKHVRAEHPQGVLALNIWQILVDECHANDESHWRNAFVAYVVRLITPSEEPRMRGDVVEWTIPGGIGRFHCTHEGRRLRVTLNPSEERFPRFVEAVQRANDRLGHLETGRKE